MGLISIEAENLGSLCRRNSAKKGNVTFQEIAGNKLFTLSCDFFCVKLWFFFCRVNKKKRTLL